MSRLPGDKTMITVLSGDNLHELNQKLREATDAFVQEHGSLALERLDGEEVTYEQILSAVESQPFLSKKKLVVIRKPGTNKEYVEKLQYILGRVAESNDLLIFEPKIDKRSSYFKQLKQAGEFLEYSQADVRDLPNWLVALAKELGGQLRPSDARLLVDRVGTNQQLLAREIEKLVTYNAQITRENIEQLCEPTPQSTVFQLLDAAFDGDKKRAIELYKDQRKQRVEPLVIVGMLAWQLHLLAIVKMAGDKDANSIAKDAKANPYVIQKTKRIASKLTIGQVRSLIREVADIDKQLKSTAVDADTVLSNLIINIAQMI